MSSNDTSQMFFFLNNWISAYTNYNEYKIAEHDFYYVDLEGLRDTENLTEMVCFAAHAGNGLRLGYYKFVHQAGIDLRIYADAIVQAYVFGSVYQFGLTDYHDKKKITDIINKTMYPFWTRFCLYGGDNKELADEGKKFSLYLDALKEKEYSELPERHVQLELLI